MGSVANTLTGCTMNDSILLLKTLYGSNDLIWIGQRYDDGIMEKTSGPVMNGLPILRMTGKRLLT